MDPHSATARARGRELALLALCHLESYRAEEHGEALALLWSSPPGEGESELPQLAAEPAVLAMAERLIGLVESHRAEVDALIEATSRSWRIERMDRVDRNVVRIAAAELAHEPNTPRAVVLAEAVRLAARYGTERSARFVNGLVEDLARALRKDEESPS